MRTLMLATLLVLLSSTPALAGKNAGGTMIVHTNDAFSYTANICNLWEGQAPADCENSHTRTDRDETTPALIWFVAAFYFGTDPAVTVLYFGVDHNLPDGSYFANYGHCGPPGSLQVPDSGWPVTGGNSVAYGTPVAGDLLFAFYYFNVYGFAGAYLGTASNPTGGYAAFVDDSNPPISDGCTRFGRVRWFVAGENECPVPPDSPLGACCFEVGTCVLLTAEGCVSQGGTYRGDDTACTADICRLALGACCFPDGSCLFGTADACAAAEGTYRGDDTFCAPNSCPILTGACCFADGHCELFTAPDCVTFQGFWQGIETVCDPNNPCPQPAQACCFTTGDCTSTTPADCLAQGGTPQGPGTICEEIACRALALGACCLSDGSCAVLSEEDCATQGGTYLPDVPCAPEDPCFAPAVQESSWGQIKRGFR